MRLPIRNKSSRGQRSPIGQADTGVTLSSISSHSGLTWLLEMPVIPTALAGSSTERVDTPCT